jgi:hypothetical protein
VEYWALVRSADDEVTIAGVSLLRFDRDGQVTEQRDYWNQSGGRHEPPPGWGT